MHIITQFVLNSWQAYLHVSQAWAGISVCSISLKHASLGNPHCSVKVAMKQGWGIPWIHVHAML